MSVKATAAEVATVAAPIYVAKLRMAIDGADILRDIDDPRRGVAAQFEADCRVIARDSVRHARLMLEAAADN